MLFYNVDGFVDFNPFQSLEDVSESIGGPGDGDHPSGDVRKKMIEKLTGFKF